MGKKESALILKQKNISAWFVGSVYTICLYCFIWTIELPVFIGLNFFHIDELSSLMRHPKTGLYQIFIISSRLASLPRGDIVVDSIEIK